MTSDADSPSRMSRTKSMLHTVLIVVALLAITAAAFVAKSRYRYSLRDWTPERPVAQEARAGRIDLGVVSLEIPEGFHDGNIYKFEDEDARASVGTWQGTYEKGDFARILREQRSRLVTPFFGLLGKIEREGPAELAGFEGYEFEVSVRHDGGMGYTRMMFAPVSDTEYVELTLEADDRSNYPEEQFARTVESAVLTRAGGAGGSAPAGFVRRYAGSLTLDVPERMTRSNRYEFERDTEDPTRSASLRVEVPGREPSDEEPFWERVEKNLMGEMTLVSARRSRMNGYELEERTYDFTIEALGMEPETSPVRAAELVFPDGVVVRVYGSGPASSKDALWKGFDALLASVRAE